MWSRMTGNFFRFFPPFDFKWDGFEVGAFVDGAPYFDIFLKNRLIHRSDSGLNQRVEEMLIYFEVFFKIFKLVKINF